MSTSSRISQVFNFSLKFMRIYKEFKNVMFLVGFSVFPANLKSYKCSLKFRRLRTIWNIRNREKNFGSSWKLCSYQILRFFSFSLCFQYFYTYIFKMAKSFNFSVFNQMFVLPLNSFCFAFEDFEFYFYLFIWKYAI